MPRRSRRNRNFAPYSTTADKQDQAAEQAARLRAEGVDLQPAEAHGRYLAKSWWGRCWNRNLERYADYDFRLDRGRSYLRCGCVLDLQIKPGVVESIVAGSNDYSYTIRVNIAPLDEAALQRVIDQSKDQLDSLNDLLAGEFPEELQELFFDADAGLFPHPSQIQFNCDCPDWADMCKHVAATLYGVGSRLDDDPSLFFTLRHIDQTAFIGKAVTSQTDELLAKAKAPSSGRRRRMTTADADVVFDTKLNKMPPPTATETPNEANGPLLDWLLANANPIIRWRIATDFSCPSVKRADKGQLLQEVMNLPLIQRWIGNLGHGGLHGSKDTDAENPMAKIVEFGLRAGIPELDAKMIPYADQIGTYEPAWKSDIINAFLIGAGYTKHPAVKKWFMQRLDRLYELSLHSGGDLFLSPEEAKGVPKAWKGRKIYRTGFSDDGAFGLPSCYDFYAIAHWPHTKKTREKAESVVNYISQPAFQSVKDGCIWDRKKNQCYSAGSLWLACCEPQRLVLFVELGARFKTARKSPWFKETLADLEGYSTDDGRYCFPADYLKEKSSYYIYGGAHMGLGENRRKRQWREIESTFRMVNIHRMMTE